MSARLSSQMMAGPSALPLASTATTVSPWLDTAIATTRAGSTPVLPRTRLTATVVASQYVAASISARSGAG